MSFTVGFLGTGNMGGSLATAAAQRLPADQILLQDFLPEKAKALAETLGCSWAETTAEVVSQCRFLFLGVKPHIMPSLLQGVRETLPARPEPPVLISMAAGLTLAQLEEGAGSHVPIIRIMPNTPVSKGVGVILYACNDAVDDTMRAEFVSLLSGAGTLYPLDEKLIDAGTAVSGCGPAFSYMFIDALADGGVTCGLSRNDALRFAAQTVLGAATMILETEKHPEQLKNDVCSPGGSTIQGVRTLENRALRSACMDAVIAAYEKSRDLGKV